MPSVGNETNHYINGATITGGLSFEGPLGANAYLNRDVAAKLARDQAVNRGMGYYAETFPRLSAASASASVSQTIYFSAIGLLQGDVVTSILTAVNAANNTATLTKLGLFTSAGVLLAATADASVAFNSTGVKSTALTAAYTVTADGLYYLGFLNVASTGASLYRTTAGLVAGGLGAFTGGSGACGTQASQADFPALGAAATIGFAGTPISYWLAVA